MNIQDLIEKYTYPSPLHDQILFELNREYENLREAIETDISRGLDGAAWYILHDQLGVLSEQLSCRLRILDPEYRKMQAQWPSGTGHAGPVDLDKVPF
jgi:flagellar biosynthesis chaperone FliJ